MSHRREEGVFGGEGTGMGSFLLSEGDGVPCCVLALLFNDIYYYY